MHDGWREQQQARRQRDANVAWRFRRCVDRTQPAVEQILAEYAGFCGRAYRRREVAPMTSAVELPGVVWSIDGEVMVELLVEDAGPSTLVVHELALVRPLKRRLRSRRLRIEHGTAPGLRRTRG